MIEMHRIKGRYCPVILCDACRERITDYHRAHILFDGAQEAGQVYHVHKGACNKAIERQIRAAGGADFWDSLDEHLYRLAFNVGLKWEKDAKKVRHDIEDFSIV
jgi:hypothetical protein